MGKRRGAKVTEHVLFWQKSLLRVQRFEFQIFKAANGNLRRKRMEKPKDKKKGGHGNRSQNRCVVFSLSRPFFLFKEKAKTIFQFFIFFSFF